MRLLLVFLVALTASGGFYEYHQNEAQVLEYTRERDQAFAHIAQLKKDQKNLRDEQGVLMEKHDYLQKQAAELKAQVAALPAPGTNAPPATPSPAPGL